MNLKKHMLSLCIAACLGALVATSSGCPQIAKDVTDTAAETQCVTAHWGEPVAQVALACTNNEIPLALDLIASIEALLQKRGTAPTTAYLADARVTQRVLAIKLKSGLDAGAQ